MFAALFGVLGLLFTWPLAVLFLVIALPGFLYYAFKPGGLVEFMFSGHEYEEE